MSDRASHIRQMILKYHEGLADDPHHRYRSWEHCYRYFRRVTPDGLARERDQAALQLGFYLASWGMYRNSFLLRHAYTVHLGVVDCLSSTDFRTLWEHDVGSDQFHTSFAPTILAATLAVRKAYHPNKPTDTLVTKVLMGTIGCLPAVDRYFKEGFKQTGFHYSWLNSKFVDRILHFCCENASILRAEQARIEAHSGIKYPVMKLADMYFFQVGYDANRPSSSGALPPAE